MTTMQEATAAAAASQNDDILLEVKDLKMHFPVSSGMLFSRTVSYVKAVDGVSFTVTIALLGLFLYPDQPILTAALFDVVGREVATTGLGVAAFVSFLMAAASPLIAGAIYETAGFHAGLYYIAGLFALAAVLFALLPLSRRVDV